MLSAPVLAYPDPTSSYILDTDASADGLGAVLSQLQNGEERVIAYWSKSLSSAEKNYCVTRRELLAVVEACKHFKPYLYGRPFRLRTDHASLIWIQRRKDPHHQVARWLEILAEFQYQIEHRKGEKHQNADGLSRRQCEDCRKCQLIEQRDGGPPRSEIIAALNLNQPEDINHLYNTPSDPTVDHLMDNQQSPSIDCPDGHMFSHPPSRPPSESNNSSHRLPASNHPEDHSDDQSRASSADLADIDYYNELNSDLPTTTPLYNDAAEFPAAHHRSADFDSPEHLDDNSISIPAHSTAGSTPTDDQPTIHRPQFTSTETTRATIGSTSANTDFQPPALDYSTTSETSDSSTESDKEPTDLMRPEFHPNHHAVFAVHSNVSGPAEIKELVEAQQSTPSALAEIYQHIKDNTAIPPEIIKERSFEFKELARLRDRLSIDSDGVLKISQPVGTKIRKLRLCPHSMAQRGDMEHP